MLVHRFTNGLYGRHYAFNSTIEILTKHADFATAGGIDRIGPTLMEIDVNELGPTCMEACSACFPYEIFLIAAAYRPFYGTIVMQRA